MAFSDYTPTSNVWWDIVGTPLQIPSANGDVYTYDNQDLSTSASNPSGYTKQGFKGKVLDNLSYLKQLVVPVGGITVAQEMRIANKLVWSDTGASSSAHFSNQSGTGTTGTIPAVFFRSVNITDWAWFALDNLPIGAQIASVAIYTLGAGADAFNVITPSTYQILKYKFATAETTLSSAVNDGHVLANWTTTVVATSVAPTSTLIVDRAYRYALKAVAPQFSAVSSGLEVRGLAVTLT